MNKHVSTIPSQPLNGVLELADDFTDDRATGTVIGSLATSGNKRLGVDVEGVLSIDNGALRIAPLVDAGFGRAVLAYGPFSSRPGLALSVYMLNGHNTAQSEPLPDTFRQRVGLWLKGSETERRGERFVQWLLSGRVLRTFRQFRRWRRTAKGQRAVPLLDENLVVGWFPNDVTPDPRAVGNGLIMHALGPENGELWAGAVSCRTRCLRGVQNLPLYFIAIIRATGIIYYVSSLDGAVGLASYPWMRPIAVDHGPCADELYVGIHQSVLGQIGWRLDSRVQGVRVVHLEGFEYWHGGAHAADKLDHNVSAGGMAEVGGRWEVFVDHAQRDSTDITFSGAVTMAVLAPGVQTGMIHAEAIAEKGVSGRFGLVWRCLDKNNYWRLEVCERTCQIILVEGGIPQAIKSQEYQRLNENLPLRLQVLDDGSRLMAYVDGEPLSDAWITDTRLREATKVGIFHDDIALDNGIIRSFEAHPQQVKLPSALDMGEPWFRKGTDVIVADDFLEGKGDLDGRLTSVGGKCWRRIIGKGVIEVTGEGTAPVRGNRQKPCPGRTAYCVDWSHPDFVDMEVTITPPGSKRGEGQRTTAGFILYQDTMNYMTLNVYRSDYYPGGSVSTFFKFGGFEDVYDAIWSNVAGRVNYGKPLRLRLCCDGHRYLVFINDEAVLYRAFRDVYPDVDRLLIRKVGLVANWEFGNDTGSKFEQFKLRV